MGINMNSRFISYSVLSSCLAGLLLVPTVSYADNIEKLASHNSVEDAPEIIKPDTSVSITQNLPKSLPQDTTQSKMSKEEAKVYLSKNPQLLEETLSLLIRNNDAEALKELLPLYANYPQKDESLLDWGNAIIAMNKGDVKTAIQLYRKINAALPDIRSVRFQLAVALFQDKQYDAAKSELVKLRSNSDLSSKDVEALNQYIDFIDKQNRWNVNFNVSYLNDDNLTNAPPEGTNLDGLYLTSKHQSGHGVGYNLGADKKFFANNQFFTALHFNIDGSYYWDNHNFNDVTAGTGVGFGYQNSKLEVELQPKFSQRWYGLGLSGDGDLHKYSDTKGLGFMLSYWMNPQWQYQNYSEYSDTSYEEPYTINDGKFSLLSNTLMYLPNQRRYFYGGLDYLNKNAPDDDQSYDRKGLRLGWGEAWDRGISTRVSVGYAKKDYDDKSRFTQIEGKDKEYNANFSIWKRDLYLMGLTPRITWSYTKIDSNDPFNEFSKNNVNLALTKTF